MKKDCLIYSEEFNKKLDSIVEEDGYEYRIIVSSTSFEINSNDKKIISDHITHIASDYQHEGLELVIANGYIKDETVYVELLMRKRVDYSNETYSD